MLNYIAVFFGIYILGSPQGLAIWWVHLLAAIFALMNLHKASQYYIFWVYLLIAFAFASEPRFSLEYVMLAAGFSAWSLSGWWQKLSGENRRNFLLISFILLYSLEKIHCIFSEKGSVLLWLPVLLSLYFVQAPSLNTGSPRRSLRSLLAMTNVAYLISGIVLLFGNKKTSLLAFLASAAIYLKSKYFYIAGAAALGASFFFRETLQHFIEKSLVSRLFIWYSSLTGWLAKPILGHGFGTFTIDFPPYRSHIGAFGAQAHQQIGHGHGLFTHILFEQGLLGFTLVLFTFYLIYKNHKQAFLPLLIISLFDAPLVYFNQYLVAALVLAPFIKDPKFKWMKFQLKPASYLAYILALTIFIPSVIGHYYYDKGSIDNAIHWDPKNSLYHFMKGADLINLDTVASEKSLETAIKLSPNVSYFYGFLAASKLANHNFIEAKTAIAQALEMDGEDQYWYVLSAFSHYADDQETYKKHYAKALALNPDMDKLLRNPNYTATEFIGSKKSDARITAFYRRGHKVFLPLPYIE